ncbi:MAG: ThiF family adenylyltransferase [Anaerolineae bacterium]|nr:ThiF family adenylyltransferase [Anaerolineae bacterium]
MLETQLEIAQRVRVEVGHPQRVLVILVGCGGTGSFLALHLARLAHHARERRGVDVQLVFVDHDAVEPKNIGRQNFCPAEIGANKAQALMVRYNRAFGLDGQAHPVRADKKLLDDGIIAWLREASHTQRDSLLTVLCGAVDNTAARLQMHQVVETSSPHCWWIDGGNHDHSGQVLIGNRTDIKKPEILPLGVCAALPAPSIQCPDLIAPPTISSPLPAAPSDAGRGAGGEGPSCADLALQDVQGLMINQMIAGWMAVYVSRLVLSYDLDIMATYIDQVGGSARSEPIVEVK